MSAGLTAEITSDVALAAYTTLRVGGPARRFVEIDDEVALVETIAAADAAGEPVLVLGGGSNIVVGDDGFDGLVVRVATGGVEVDADACSGATVHVAAGENWDDFVSRAAGERWVGVECLSGIPGLVGATPIQNVGAYGQEVGQSVARVRVYDRVQRARRTLFYGDCAFGYRTSRFKREPHRYVVLSVTYQLRLGDLAEPLRYADLAAYLGVDLGARLPLADVRAAVLAVRAAKGMLLDDNDPDSWSAGSFFTNPVLTDTAYADLCRRIADVSGVALVPPRYPAGDNRVKTSAAWLIEQAGFRRGYGSGRTTLSGKHTLSITNRGGAAASDVLDLAREIRAGVVERFGVMLEAEPIVIGAEF